MDTAGIATLLADAILTEFGDDATWYPMVGIPVAVKVFIRRGEQLVDGLGVTSLRTDGRLLEIRKSSLLIAPQVGDAIRIGDVNWRVRGLRPSDPAEIVWVLDCVPDDL